MHHITKSQKEEKGYIKWKILVIFRNGREQIFIGLENTTQTWSTVKSYFSLVTKMDILLVLLTEMIFIGIINFDVADSGMSPVPNIWESWFSMNSCHVELYTPLYEHSPLSYSPTLLWGNPSSMLTCKNVIFHPQGFTCSLPYWL